MKMHDYAVSGTCSKEGEPESWAWRLTITAATSSDARLLATSIMRDAGYVRVVVDSAEILRLVSTQEPQP
jgi:hypothetical protein